MWWPRTQPSHYSLTPHAFPFHIPCFCLTCTSLPRTPRRLNNTQSSNSINPKPNQSQKHSETLSLSLSLSQTFQQGDKKLSMDSEVPSAPSIDKASTMVEKSRKGSHGIKKKQVKVPKRIHKAEREKMKREHLNELFLALANALELTDQNNGKACILGEATRIVRDTLAQIEYLKRENATLLSESLYVTTEKNELRDENSALEIQIEKLQRELGERMAQSKLDLNVAPPESQQPVFVSYTSEDNLGLPAADPPLQQAPAASHLYVIPFSNVKVYSESDAAQFASKPVPNVSRPEPRYPSAADSWPSQLLEKHPELGKELLQSNSNSSSCHGGEQSLGNV